MKELHLICNAHLDPMWQWEWEEGAAAAVSTFRCAADFCEEFDGFVFNHNEALLYRWIEEYEPALFERIRVLVQKKKWHIMGGWYLQPDCNMPSGESFLRQIEEGRRYFREKFGVAPPKTAVNLDPFGHSRGLVQILAKTGYENYLFMRPDPPAMHVKGEEFLWEGYDGSHVLAHHIWAGYGNDKGAAAAKIEAYIAQHPDFQTAAVLWGVGDHGGGPSRKDLQDIDELIKRMKEQGVEVLHSTPEAYFARRRCCLAEKGEELPHHAAPLRPSMPGCYTTQIRLKQARRRLEALLLSVEKMASHANLAGLLPYPAPELKEAQRDLLLAQFHDVLPGSSVERVEQAGLRTMGHGMELLYRLRARLFFALAAQLPAAPEGTIPLVAYNPHPYTVEDDFCCEFTLAGHNFSDEFVYIPRVYEGETLLPSQLEKEAPNTNFDWRKRVVFRASLPPFSMRQFICRLEKQPTSPGDPAVWRSKPAVEDAFAGRPVPTAPLTLSSCALEVTWNPEDGGLCRVKADGREMICEPPVLELCDDIPDSWGMNDFQNNRLRGTFRLATPEEAGAISGLKQPLPPLRLIEDGEVRRVVEGIYVCAQSWAVVQWALPQEGRYLDCSIRLFAQQPDTLYLLRIPTVLGGGEYLGQDVFGTASLPADGEEQTHHGWCGLSAQGRMMAVINDGIYASHAEKGRLFLTLLRTPAYCSHRLLDRELVPQDRFSPRVDRGQHLYAFRFLFGEREQVMADLDRRAQSFQEKPMLLSFFPAGGSGMTVPAPICLPEGSPVVLTSLMKTGSGRYRMRLYNPHPIPQALDISSPLLNMRAGVELAPYEAAAYVLDDKGIISVPLVEG